MPHPSTDYSIRVFLEEREFRPMHLSDRERVMGLRVAPCFTLRVYTGVRRSCYTQHTSVPDRGQDPLRLRLYWMDTRNNNSVFRVGHTIPVMREGPWRLHLSNHISAWHHLIGPRCACCDAPMRRVTTGPHGPFLGCCRYKTEGCDYTLGTLYY